MAEEPGRLLATSIAQLEQPLSAQIGDGFEEVNKKMDKIEERGTMKEKIENIAKNKTAPSSGNEDSVWSEDDEVETARLESSKSPSIISSDGISGWTSFRSSQYSYAEDDPRTAIEPGNPREEDSYLFWKDGDEFIKVMQAERMSKDGEIPSFWNDDPSCLPKEFVGLAKNTFLVDPSVLNICFLDKDILCKISKMLSPNDFLNLSYTCHYLHWRLFTFCTYYVSYEANVDVRDLKVDYYYKRGEKVSQMYEITSTKTVYSCSVEENARHLPLLAKQEGIFRFFRQVISFLSTVSFQLPFCTKDDFDRCLALIMPVRKYACRLDITIYYFNLCNSDRYFDYEAADNFWKAINVTSVDATDRFHGPRRAYVNRLLKLYDNCPYVRLMDRVELHFRGSGSKYEDAVFLNRVGKYHDPPVSAIIENIKEFRYGTANLDYHEYELRNIGKYTAFMEYFFATYPDYEEYYHEYAVYSCRETCVESKFIQLVTVMTEATLSPRTPQMDVS